MPRIGRNHDATGTTEPHSDLQGEGGLGGGEGREDAGGAGAEPAEATDLLGLAQSPSDSRVLDQIGDPGGEDLVAGEAEDVADPVALAPGHGLVPGIGLS